MTNLCETRQVDKSQAEDMRGVDFKIDGLSVNAFVVSCYPSCLVLNLAPDFGKVVEASTRNMKELSPFLLLAGKAGWGVGNMNLFIVIVVFTFTGQVDELQDKWPPSDDATTSGKKVSADDILKDRRLSRRLRAYDDLDQSASRHSWWLGQKNYMQHAGRL